jgi:hypothetical protein
MEYNNQFQYVEQLKQPPAVMQAAVLFSVMPG